MHLRASKEACYKTSRAKVICHIINQLFLQIKTRAKFFATLCVNYFYTSFV